VIRDIRPYVGPVSLDTLTWTTFAGSGSYQEDSMHQPSAAQCIVGLMTALLVACAPGAAFTPGTAEMPRTVVVSAFDTFAFDPARIPVQAGETIRFAVTNQGLLEHEFAIGSRAQLQEHAQVMTHGGMRDDTSSAIRLLPGQTKELIYTFGSATDIGYGCFVIGHFPKGMSGAFDIVR